MLSVYLYNPVNSDQKKANDYLLAIKEKHILLNKRKGNRILFVGGSGVAFGTDAGNFSPNAINLGLHAGLGLSFMVKEAIHFAREGDLLVVSTEYFLDNGDKAMISYMLDQVPEVGEFLKLSAFEQIELPWVVFLKSLKEKVKRIQMTVIEGKEKVKLKDVNTLYIRTGFNNFGDYVNHLGKERPWSLFFRYPLEDRPYDEEIHILNQLSELQKKGVKVVYVFPAYDEIEFKKYEKAILSFEKQLKTGLKFPVIGSPTDFIYPEEYFYDTVYHLAEEGRKKRLERLKVLLKDFLPVEKSQMDQDKYSGFGKP